MDLPRDIQMPDMNIPCNLDFFRQIIEFENDIANLEITFNNLDRSQQRAVQSIAHSRNLEYEYQQGCAKVFRSIASGPNSSLPFPADQAISFRAAWSGPDNDPGLHRKLPSSSLQMDPLTNLDLQQPSQHINSKYQQPYIEDAMQRPASSSDGEFIPTAIVIKNIPFAVKKEQLVGVMCDKGLPLPYALNYHFDNGVFRGLAFADFCTSEETSTVINALNHMDLKGRKLRVEYKKMLPAHERERIEREKTASRNRLQEQQQPMNWSMNGFTVPSLDMRYSGDDRSANPQSRHSGSSFAMSSTEALADMPSYEDFSAALWWAPAFTHEQGQTSRSNSLMSSARLSPIASPRMGPMDLHEAPQGQSRKIASRSGSVNSMQSDRGRNRVTKSFARSSSVGRFSPGIGESMFSSRQERSSRRSSSGASGRTGPLDYLARIGMKAVKAIGGACWRCKILGKKCTDENPCDTCPKRNKPGKAAWTRVGCKRGTLREEMEPVNLCPKSRTMVETSETIFPTDTSEGLAHCNKCENYWRPDELISTCPRCQNLLIDMVGPLGPGTKMACLDMAMRRRKQDIMSEIAIGGNKMTLINPVLRNIRNNILVEDLGQSNRITSPHCLLTSLLPLDECILAIIWELVANPLHLSPPSIFTGGSEESLENIIILLRSAALYQAKLEFDPYQLIAQSLICLREALETRRAKSFGAFEDFSHQTCLPSLQLCDDKGISSLTSSVTRYIEQLSHVFFKKQNLRGKTWWLSVFYSLVIQSFVRKSLLATVEDLPSTPPSMKEYLQLAVRLFTASSGDHDPLMRDWSGSKYQFSEDEVSNIENYEAAKLSTRQGQWSSAGLGSSGDFLQQLFEDDGLPIAARAEMPLSPPLVSTDLFNFSESAIDPHWFMSYTDPVEQAYYWPVTNEQFRPSQGSPQLMGPQQESTDHVRILRPKPQCWEHGCNGRQFSTFSNLLRHQRDKNGQAAKAVCLKCGEEFTRTTARDHHMAHGKCTRQRNS